MEPFALKRKMDWVGLKVESTVQLRNGLGDIPKGAIFEVHSSRHKANLWSVQCPTCGVRFSIYGVDTAELIPRFDLTIIDDLNKIRRRLGVEELKGAP